MINLPKKFKFNTLDPKKKKDILALTTFLNSQYYSNTSNDGIECVYSPEYVSYRLRYPTLHFVRNKQQIILTLESNDDILGAVVARPTTYKIDGVLISSFFVEWLTTHSKLRGRRMAIVLLKELYRRLHENHVECGAIFFAPSTSLPFQPIVECARLFVRDLHSKMAQEYIEKLRNARNNSTAPEEIKRLNKLLDETENSDQLKPTKDIHQIRLANKADMEKFGFTY